MKVAYLTAHNPYDPFSWSGINYYMFKALRAEKLDLTYVGRSLWPRSWHFPKPLRQIASHFDRKNASPDDYLKAARQEANLLEKELRLKPYDVIFTPVSSQQSALLDTALPIAYLSDATFRLLKNYYPSVRAWPEKRRQQSDFLETKMIERADALLYPSLWAANSAIKDYGASPEKVSVIPFGANMDKTEDLDSLLKCRQNDELRLLFLGKESERKGGDIAFEAVQVLNSLGIKTRLVVCGVNPPPKCRSSNVTVLGFLSKNKPKELRKLTQLFCSCHFMFVPSRAECLGVIFAEASAYALPVISTRTGGIPGVVFEGKNGFLLPLEATGKEFSELIASIFRDRERYLQLAISSRTTYENELNWEVWAKQVRKKLESLI